MTIRTLRLLALGPLLAAAAACSLSGPAEESGPLARMDRARQVWEASGILQYELRMRRICGECPPSSALDVVVVVSGGAKTVTLAGSGEPVEANPDLYPDVDGLFELIEAAVRAGGEIEVEYDDELGYPRVISVDPIPDAVDDEFGYAIELVAGRLAELRTELRVQRERWRAQGIADYQLTLARSCFCAPEGAGLVVVTVLEGEPVQRLYFLSGDPVSPEWQAVFPGVEGLFAFLADALDRSAEAIDVTFDPQLGLPTHIYVDYRRGAADEEIGYEVEKVLRIDRGEPRTREGGG